MSANQAYQVQDFAGDLGGKCLGKIAGPLTATVNLAGPLTATVNRIFELVNILDKEIESTHECFGDVLSERPSAEFGGTPYPPISSALDGRLQSIEGRIGGAVQRLTEIRKASTL